MTAKKVKAKPAQKPTAEGASSGIKFDQGKASWFLLPFDALEEIVKVLDFGAVKYDYRNWEKGMHWSRVFGSLLRHLFAFWRGRNTDRETALHELAHAGCCVLFLLSYAIRKGHEKYDDRPFTGSYADALPAVEELGSASWPRARAPKRNTVAKGAVPNTAKRNKRVSRAGG